MDLLRERAAAGHAPFPLCITLKPDTADLGEDLAQCYEALRCMSAHAQCDSYIIKTQTLQMRGRSQPYLISVPNEMAQAYEDEAEFTYRATTRTPAAWCWQLHTDAQRIFEVACTAGELGGSFLREIFRDFDLSEDALKSLGMVLEQFVGAVDRYSRDGVRTTRNISQLLRVNSVARINVTGDASEPIWIFDPIATFIYMKIDPAAWGSAMKACSTAVSDTRVKFSMTSTITTCKLNMRSYAQTKPQFEATMQSVMGESLEEYAARLEVIVTNSMMNPDAGP